MNQKNFDFTQIPDKTNDVIFLKKKQKPCFWVIFDGSRDRQTLFHRTLPAEARNPTTFLQQVTGGNTPNLVLERMLRYFLKLPPLKILKI